MLNKIKKIKKENSHYIANIKKKNFRYMIVKRLLLKKSKNNLIIPLKNKNQINQVFQ